MVYLRNAYERQDTTVQESSHAFCKKYPSKITAALLAPTQDLANDRTARVLLAGHILTTALNTQKAVAARAASGSSNVEHFQNIRGAPFYEKSTFKHTSDPPFNGEQISTDGFPAQTKPPHVHLKRCLFIFVGRGLKNSDKLNSVSFVLPGERYTRGASASFPFPVKFYENLRTLFLQ